MRTNLLVILALLLIVPNGWCALVTYEDIVTLNARLTDWGGRLDISETYDHHVGAAVDLDAVTGAQLILDTADVNSDTSTISMTTVSLITAAGAIEIGTITPNWYDPTVDTVVTFTGSSLDALVQYLKDNNRTLTIVVQSGLVTEGNYEDFWLYTSTLDVTYDNGEPNPVPEPATVILTLGGLLGLFGVARRKR
jgi:hypothetical protein